MPRAVVRGVWGQALPLSLPPVLRAGGRCPLPMCYGRGCAAVGAQHCPFGVRALCGIVCRRGGGRAPRGGGVSPLRGAFGVRQFTSPGRPSFGRAARPCCLRFPGVGGLGVGTQHRPHRAGAAGVVGGRTWGGASRRCEGRPHTGLRGLGTCPWGSPTTCCGRGCASVGARHCPFGVCVLPGVARRGGGGRWPRGGGITHCCEGCLVSRAFSLPAAHPEGRQQGAVARMTLLGVVWAGGPRTGPTACALASRRCAVWGWREGVP